jgi:hypothetical protein
MVGLDSTPFYFLFSGAGFYPMFHLGQRGLATKAAEVVKLRPVITLIPHKDQLSPIKISYYYCSSIFIVYWSEDVSSWS